MSEKEATVVNSALRQLERYSPSLAKRYTAALQDLNNPKINRYKAMEQKLKDYFDNISDKELCRELMECGMKFENPLV